MLDYVAASFGSEILVDFNTAIFVFIRECMWKRDVLTITKLLLVAIDRVKFLLQF